MKKLTFLKAVLIIIIAVSLVTFFKAIYDDDSVFDFLCANNNFLLYASFLLVLLPCVGIFRISVNDFTFPELLISYLASKEKSPPASYSRSPL